MLYFLAISPINQTMIIAVIVIAGFIVGCLLVRFIIRKIGKRTFRKLDIGFDRSDQHGNTRIGIYVLAYPYGN